MKKRMISLLLALVMCTAICIPTYAYDEPVESALRVSESGSRALQSRSEMISILMDKAGYSYADAVQASIAYSPNSRTAQERWIKYYVNSSYEIEVGCLVWVESGGGHSNFGEIIDSWSAASGPGTYSWNEFYTRVEVTGTYNTSLRFRSRGALEVTYNRNVDTGIDISGLNLSASVGYIEYYRKTVSIDRTWSVGDPY